MKYRIEESDGVFTPQFKFLWWWKDFGYSFCNKERAVQRIKEHHEYQEPEPIYHYINPQDLN